jgi:hypothetical protein
MKPIATASALAVAVLAAPVLRASGPVGIYGIVERVVFEPSEQAPERIQVWGAFALVDGGTTAPVANSAPKRGYVYFKLPVAVEGFVTPADVALVRREWTDLKTIAGTGQAIGFGSWQYIGRFDEMQQSGKGYIFENVVRPLNGRMSRGGQQTDLRVRAATEKPASPVTYQTDSGIVKLAATGSHSALVQQLQAMLKK